MSIVFENKKKTKKWCFVRHSGTIFCGT
jgi:hypothetical protein